VIRGNVAWGNDAGIALEGASRNAIQGNLLIGNRVGLRLKDTSSANQVVGNAVVASSILGLLISAGSADNAVTENRVFGGKVGIALNGATGNQVAHNSIAWITGRGIVLSGTGAGTSVTGNTISGKGTAAIDTNAARDLPRRGVTANVVTGWIGPRQFREIYTAGNFLRHHPAIVIWLAIFAVPLAWWLPARRRRLLTWGQNIATRGAP
jgi:parallel beta-helix repeat protein